MSARNVNKILIALLLGGVVVAGVWALSEREPDTIGEHIDASIDNVSDKIEDAGDAISDAADDVKDELD